MRGLICTGHKELRDLTMGLGWSEIIIENVLFIVHIL